VNDFREDNEWQRRLRDEILAPGFYGKFAVDGRYVVIDKGVLATQLQRDYAVDTVAQGRNGAAIFIEEKIVRWKGRSYSAFALETKSCTLPGIEKPGWMFYGRADFLLYAFQQANGDLICWLIDFPKLQEWFWPLETSFPTFQMSERNRSSGRVVPIEAVRAGVPTWRRLAKVPAEAIP
jgi:hypothetical protein